MTKTDLFRVLIKLCAIYALVATIINTLPAAIPYLGLFGEMSSTDDVSFVVFWVAGTLLISIGLFFWLIRNPDSLIRKFRLNEGFDDERIDSAILSQTNILQLALAIIGGYFFVESLIYFLTNSYAVFYNSLNGITSIGRDWYNTTQYFWVVSGLKTLAGYLIFWNHRPLASWILKQRNTTMEQDEVESEESTT